MNTVWTWLTEGVGGKLSEEEQRREDVRRVERVIRSQQLSLERQIEASRKRQEISRLQCRAAARKGDVFVTKDTARNLARERKFETGLVTQRANINSIRTQIRAAMVTQTSQMCLQRGTAVMASINAMTSVQGMRDVAREFSRELFHAAQVQELMDETMEEGFDDDEGEIDALVDAEVDNVMREIIGNAAFETLSSPPREATRVQSKDQSPPQKDSREEAEEMLEKLERMLPSSS